MAGIISQRELTIIDKLKRLNIFQDVDKHRLRGRGAIVITCGDGRRFWDIYSHPYKLFYEVNGSAPILHPAVRLGGLVNLAPDSPICPSKSFREEYIEEIRKALKIMEVEQIIATGHWPCSMCQGHNLDYETSLQYHLLGKMILKKTFPHVKVANYAHVDYGTRMKTYFTEGKYLLPWLRANATRQAQQVWS